MDCVFMKGKTRQKMIYIVTIFMLVAFVIFFQAEDGIRDHAYSRGFGDVYKGHGWISCNVIKSVHEETGSPVY